MTQARLHRIEALAGDGRYAVTFTRADGSEQTAVVHVVGERVDVAESALPTGWTTDTDPFRATAQAVLAVHAARQTSDSGPELRDVDGGWDVMMGNVVLDADGRPECSGHGVMTDEGERWVCAECGAAALLG
jgi:ribosomal protein S27AE